MRLKLLIALICPALIIAVAVTNAQLRAPQSRPTAVPTPQSRPSPVPAPTIRKASELIRRQAPLQVNQGLLKQVTPDTARIMVSLSKQRAYLVLADQVVIDCPISSGKRGHSSPAGHMRVLEKDANHHSSLYGDFVDSSGRIVRAGVSARIDAAPSGTRFVGSPMKWFLRLTEDGVGMHIGILPGYPASHGCIRLPPDGAKLFYDHVKVGTPVDVTAAE